MKYCKAKASASYLFAKQFGNSQTIYLLNMFFLQEIESYNVQNCKGQLVYLLLKCIEQKQQKMAKLTSSYPHTTNNFQPQNLFFSVKIIVKHTDEQFKVQNQRRREKRWGEKMLTSLERRLPWLGNTNCIVVSREKKISGLVCLYYISSLYLLQITQWNKN